jgi:hypothetical protein
LTASYEKSNSLSRYRSTRRGGLRRMLPGYGDCCEKPKTIAAQRLGIGIVRKGDQRRKTGAATRAMPNVTGVLVAPILGSHRRNQLSIAVSATHQHRDPHSPPRPAIIVPLQIGKSESISGPLLLCGVKQWIGRPCAPQPTSRAERYRLVECALNQSIGNAGGQIALPSMVPRRSGGSRSQLMEEDS